AEGGIRDSHVTGVQTCALPIYQKTLMPLMALTEISWLFSGLYIMVCFATPGLMFCSRMLPTCHQSWMRQDVINNLATTAPIFRKIGRASCRDRVCHPALPSACT